MKEVEVKAKINNPDNLTTQLKDLGCELGDPIIQNDIIFLPAGLSYEDDLLGRNILRIRKTDGRIVFTLKQPQSNELDCIEKELEIGDVENMEEILKLVGFYEAVRVNKTRVKCKYKDYKICIDKVEELGDFIEVEKITDEDAAKVQDELFDFLQSIGVDKDDREVHGYDTLMYNKNNK